MPNRHPQILVTLSPEGQLVLELPGSQATRRQLVCRDSDIAQTLHRMLEAQQADRTEIGLDGSPTQAQVSHWERHSIWPQLGCRFCVSEGRTKPDYDKVRVKRKVVVYKTPQGVEVRRIKSGQSGLIAQSQARHSPEDLGL